MKITDSYGLSDELLDTVSKEARRLADLGYNVPDIHIRWLPAPLMGLSGANEIMVHPAVDPETLRFAVAHEIGHHNEPQAEFNLWDDAQISETVAERRQRAEDWADWFASHV